MHDRSLILHNEEYLTDAAFKDLTDLFPENTKKAIWVATMYAGSFTEEYDNEPEPNSFVIGAGPYCGHELLANDTWLTNNVTENEQIPPITGETYFHGEFDFHLYGSATGKSPDGINNYFGTFYSTADVNADQIVSMEEIWDWTYDHDDGEYTGNVNGLSYLTINNNVIGNTTSLEYPTLLHTTYNADKTRRGLIGVSKDFNVTNQHTLTIKENAIVHFLNTADITVDAGATLVIEDDVTLISKSGTRRITVNGDISIGDNVNFKGEDGSQLYLELNNTEDVLTISNGTFEDAAIISDIVDLTITNTDFISGGLYGLKGDYTITNGCIFDESFAHFSNASANTKNISISNECSFENAPIDAIKISNYPNFTINGCIIDNGDGNGIYLLNSGYGKLSGTISNCDITNNTSSSSGITIYNTSVKIIHNDILDNYYGIKSFNRSNVYIEGNSHYISQQINNNISYEIYASRGSFPYHIKWNSIVDEDNPQPMVYYSGGDDVNLDVKNNYWGNNFNYLTDLYPSANYSWQPIWTPPGSKSGIIAESYYYSAKDKIEQGDFTGAKADFQLVVTEEPGSHFAQAALRDMFDIEKFGDNDYLSLKEYYDNEPAIQNDDLLLRRGRFLSTMCDIKLENWQVAINWFESIIINPESEEDSIFAIIDLGYLYFLMENGGFKSSHIGNLLEHKPESLESFNIKTDYLLSLLPGDQLSKEMLNSLELLEIGELLQNVPNPFKGSTQIWYKLENEAQVQINIHNYSGQLINTFDLGTKTGGSHFMDFNAIGLKNGIYFYSISINGQTTDTKKMTIMK